jgi:hypothetical protein
MGDDYQPVTGRLSGREESTLTYRVIWVVYRPRKRIAEDGGRLLEGYVVFREILGGLLRIPLKSHSASLPRSGGVSLWAPQCGIG